MCMIIGILKIRLSMIVWWNNKWFVHATDKNWLHHGIAVPWRRSSEFVIVWIYLLRASDSDRTLACFMMLFLYKQNSANGHGLHGSGMSKQFIHNHLVRMVLSVNCDFTLACIHLPYFRPTQYLGLQKLSYSVTNVTLAGISDWTDSSIFFYVLFPPLKLPLRRKSSKL